MTATAQAGILAFGPQPVKDTMAHESVDAEFTDSLLSDYTLDGSPHTLETPADLRELPVPGKLVFTKVSGASLTADFVVTGIEFGDPLDATPVTETVAFAGDTVLRTTKVFRAVTSIAVPAGAGRVFRIGHRMAPVAFRHRAADIDLSAIDDVRMGPMEIGGVPVPTFPYKGGQLVTGGATLYPRLESSFLYLLWGAVGFKEGQELAGGVTYLYEEGVINEEAIAAIIDSHALTVGASTVLAAAMLEQPSDPSRITVRRSMADAGTPWTGNVVITGTDSADAALVETLTFGSGSGAAETDILETEGLFKTLVSVEFPGYTTGATDVADVGYAMYDHVFTYNPGEGLAACLPWMSFYKFIPSGACTPNSTDSLWEEYEDCKIAGMQLTLPNDGPIVSRFDVLGRKWHFSETNPLTYMGEYEDYQSVPVGCHTGGWIKIPTYSASELPVVSAQLSMANTPLDIRQEKVYGSPDLDDITIVSRAVGIDLVVKWRDPDLYRKIYTGSVDGTEWSEKPFVESLDVLAVSNSHPFDCASPWKLRLECPSVLFQIGGGVRLAGNQAVMLRMTGTAIAPSNDATPYVTVTLTNRDRLYRWPTS